MYVRDAREEGLTRSGMSYKVLQGPRAYLRFHASLWKGTRCRIAMWHGMLRMISKFSKPAFTVGIFEPHAQHFT